MRPLAASRTSKLLYVRRRNGIATVVKANPEMVRPARAECAAQLGQLTQLPGVGDTLSMRLAGSHVITLLDLARMPSAKVDTISGRKHPFGHGKSWAGADLTLPGVEPYEMLLPTGGEYQFKYRLTNCPEFLKGKLFHSIFRSSRASLGRQLKAPSHALLTMTLDCRLPICRRHSARGPSAALKGPDGRRVAAPAGRREGRARGEPEVSHATI